MRLFISFQRKEIFRQFSRLNSILDDTTSLSSVKMTYELEAQENRATVKPDHITGNFKDFLFL